MEVTERPLVQARYPVPGAYRNPYVTPRRGRRPGVTDLVAATLDSISRLPTATNRCIAGIVGISGERVRQIREEHSLRPKRNPNTLITWPCPTCGAEVRMWTSMRNASHPKSVWCRNCCRRETGKLRRLDLRPVVCQDCRKERIYKGRSNALRAMKKPPKRCNSCHARSLHARAQVP